MEKIIESHKIEYNVKPDVIATAPGRFHLLGEQTWFFRDKTLSMAVNLPVYVSVSLRDDSNLRFNFVQMEEKKKSSLSSLKFKKEDKWANAIKSVLFGFQNLGYNLNGMDFTTSGILNLCEKKEKIKSIHNCVTKLISTNNPKGEYEIP